MDLEEWEILSNEDQENNKGNISPKSINMDYFHEFPDHQSDYLKQSDDQQIISKELLLSLNNNNNNNNNSLENQFVDTKIDSPKSLNRVKKVEEDEKMVVYEEKKGNFEEGLSEKVLDLNSCMSRDRDGVEKEKEGENGGVNIWKWAMSGMGALVTFGFTAVTISLVVLNNHHHKDGNNCKNNQDLHFQIFSHDKRFKQVVRRAQRLNEAISVMRGAPITTAHITIGGYHEGL